MIIQFILLVGLVAVIVNLVLLYSSRFSKIRLGIALFSGLLALAMLVLLFVSTLFLGNPRPTMKQSNFVLVGYENPVERTYSQNWIGIRQMKKQTSKLEQELQQAYQLWFFFFDEWEIRRNP